VRKVYLNSEPKNTNCAVQWNTCATLSEWGCAKQLTSYEEGPLKRRSNSIALSTGLYLLI